MHTHTRTQTHTTHTGGGGYRVQFLGLAAAHLILSQPSSSPGGYEDSMSLLCGYLSTVINEPLDLPAFALAETLSQPLRHLVLFFAT